MPSIGMSSPQTNLKLTYFHMEIARLIGEGLPNREIKKYVQISDSRLSILRANPLIRRAAERYRQMNEDKYRKALETFANGAQATAQTVVDMVKNPLVDSKVKLEAAAMIMEHASYLSPESQKRNGGGTGGEVVFEQLLRVTKRGIGQYADDQPMEFDPAQAQNQLGADLVEAERLPVDDTIDDQPDMQCPEQADPDLPKPFSSLVV